MLFDKDDQLTVQISGITKNGTDMVVTTDYSFTNGVITLVNAAASNDKYKVTVQVEDAPAETKIITVPL